MSRMYTFDTASPADTEALGARLGAALRGSEILELSSDLGGGKTTFTRGLVRGAGSADHVASPTFTISREYQSGELRLYHYDFYRLAEAGLMAATVADSLSDPEGVVIVEWSDIVHDVLPADRLTVIRFEPTGESSRRLHITCPERFAYLAEALIKAAA